MAEQEIDTASGGAEYTPWVRVIDTNGDDITDSVLQLSLAPSSDDEPTADSWLDVDPAESGSMTAKAYLKINPGAKLGEGVIDSTLLYYVRGKLFVDSALRDAAGGPGQYAVYRQLTDTPEVSIKKTTLLLTLT